MDTFDALCLEKEEGQNKQEEDTSPVLDNGVEIYFDWPKESNLDSSSEGPLAPLLQQSYDVLSMQLLSKQLRSMSIDDVHGGSDNARVPNTTEQERGPATKKTQPVHQWTPRQGLRRLKKRVVVKHKSMPL
jgi:hypothetical protein